MKCGLFYCCLWAVLFDVWFHAKQRIAVLLQTNGCLLVCIKLQEKGDLLFGCCKRMVLCSLIFVECATGKQHCRILQKRNNFGQKQSAKKEKSIYIGKKLYKCLISITRRK